MNCVDSFRTLAALTLSAIFGLAQTPAPPPPPQQPYVFAFADMPASYLGVGFQDVDAERARTLKLAEERGVEVTKIEDGSPASKAGLQLRDVILEYNGQRVEGTSTFMRFVKETPAGREIKLTVSRSGQMQTVPLTTAARKQSVARSAGGWQVQIPELPEMPVIVMPDMPQPNMSWSNGNLGISAEGVSGEFAEFFGAKAGVLIRSVRKDTPAERAGLRVGDLIVRFDDVAVASVRQISAKIRNEGDKRTFTVALMRNKAEMSLPVTLDPLTESRPRGGRAIK